VDDVLVDLRVGQERLRGEMDVLRTQQGSNHSQNRSDIHDLRGTVQGLLDSIEALKEKIGKINLQLARLGGYAAGAGAVVALIVKLIDHIWK
jgi:hypothetical protein